MQALQSPAARERQRAEGRAAGPYAIQAAISAVHADASDGAATDWAEIVGLYDVLARADASPVIALNRAGSDRHARRAAAGSR